MNCPDLAIKLIQFQTAMQIASYILFVAAGVFVVLTIKMLCGSKP